MKDVIIDAILDSLKVFIVVLVFNFILSFIENKLSKKLEHNKFSPLIGASVGLIPQCGFSVVAGDMYSKKKISMGTILAVFIACSDEALPLLLSNPDKILYFIPLLSIKFTLAVIVGYLVDLFVKSEINEGKQVFLHHGCCHHEIENESFKKAHIIHPLVHSLKIFGYVLVINLIFGICIYFIGEDVISSFITSNYYLSPILSILIGLIPNCASSIILCELFMIGSLPFSSMLAGLICNAGLGLVYIFKNKSNIKNNLKLLLILIITSIVAGYVGLLIESII